MSRFYCPTRLQNGATLDLPPSAARHVQVLRMQPGDAVRLFNGEGGEFDAQITRMGRSEVQVLVGQHDPIEREASLALHLVVGMPANERMDWLVEKATELGVASIQPLATARTVLKLKGERADKKRGHWQGVAIAASEQCGRNRVPVVHPVLDFSAWIALHKNANQLFPIENSKNWVLSLRAEAKILPVLNAVAEIDATEKSQTQQVFLSGPEGGLTPQEEAAAIELGFSPASLGARVLRAETAALAALARLLA